MSNCDCFEQVLEKAKDLVAAGMSAKEAETLEADWKNKTILVEGGGGRTAIGLPVETEYQKFKKSGEPYKNKTKDKVNIHMTFCPFCGEEMSKGDSDGTA